MKELLCTASYFTVHFLANERDPDAVLDDNMENVTVGVEQAKRDLFQQEAFDLVFNLQRFSNKIQPEEEERGADSE